MQSPLKHYYNINRILTSDIGGWPMQNKLAKILLPCVILSLIFSVGFLEFIKLCETWRNFSEACECILIIIIVIGGYVKLHTVVLNDKNIERLLLLIEYHWRIFTHSLEISVMHDYAIVGKKMTIIYAVGIYGLMILYMLMPLTPQLMDLVMPLNRSRPYKYIFNIDYNFDKEKYYYPVLFHSYITVVFIITVMVAVDTIYMAFAQHGCSLFAAIGQRLEGLALKTNSSSNNRSDENIEINCNKQALAGYTRHLENDEIYREIIFVLRKHQLSLEFIHLLDSSFAIYSVVILFINLIATSLLGIQVITLWDRKEEMVRFAGMGIGAFMHLFVLSYPGQRVMDHSADIFHKAYNMKWYDMSRKSTQLLNILFQKSIIPCTLTAGKICVLSMANYAAMLRASVSYFTAFSSFK